MYPPEAFPVELVGEFLPDSTALRAFRGNLDFGWKLAWSDRLLSMFGSLVITGYIYALLHKRRNFQPLSTRWMLILVFPLILDGATHYHSDFTSLTAGYRWDNAWLAALTFNSFPESVYVGDQLGSFNSLARIISGILWGIGWGAWGLNILEGQFERSAKILEDRLAAWRKRNNLQTPHSLN